MVLSYNEQLFKKTKSVLLKIKKNEMNSFLYDFEKNHIYNSDLKNIINQLNKEKINVKDLNNKNNNFKKGVLATFLKLCHFTYYYTYINKRNFFKIPVLYFDSEMLVTKYENNIFISLRGTNFNDVEYFHDFVIYKETITNIIQEKLLDKFELWKNNLLKNYPIENILSRKYISTKFKFHKGFYSLYKAYKIYKKVKYILLSNKKYKNIYIVGHSMGTTFSNLLILDLYNFSYLEKRKLNINMVSFGAPGCMNSNLSLFYFYLSSIGFISKYIRIYNKNDIIVKTFSDKDDYIASWFGILRHINSTIPNKNKSIVKKHNYDCSKNFVLFDLQKNLKKFIKKDKKLSYEELHNLYSFSDNKDSCLFYL